MKEPQGCNVEFLSHLFTKSMLFVYQSTPYLSFSKT